MNFTKTHLSTNERDEESRLWGYQSTILMGSFISIHNLKMHNLTKHINKNDTIVDMKHMATLMVFNSKKQQYK